MNETNLVRQILLAASAGGHRLFRQNVGTGWIGATERATVPISTTLYPGDVLIRNARPLHAGLCKGSSDIIGWRSDGTFVAIEAKSTKGRVRDEQERFIDAVRSAGGRAGVARSVDEAMRIIVED